MRHLILAHHSQPNSATPYVGAGTLTAAAMSGHADLDMTRLVVGQGCDTDAREGLGETALHKAAANGHADVVKVLLAAGFNETATNLAGEKPADVAHRAHHQNSANWVRPTSKPANSARGAVTRRCPDGPLDPGAACGHLEPRSYIAELQRGPGDVYSSMRRHPPLFDAQASAEGWPLAWFAPAVRSALAMRSGDARNAALAGLLEEESSGVYSLQLFSPEFAEMFLAEVEHYKASGLPVRRVNSMNRFGLIVNEIGMYLLCPISLRRLPADLTVCIAWNLP